MEQEKQEKQETVSQTTELATEIQIILNEEKELASSHKEEIMFPLCHCGKKMEKFAKEESGQGGRNRCNQCHYSFCADQPFAHFFSCPSHPKASLCEKCGEYSARFTQNNDTYVVKDMHDASKLYYVYTNRIIGPYTVDEIIKLYVDRKLKHKIYIQHASDSDNWSKLRLPESHRENLQKTDARRCDMMQWCEEINFGFKEKFPQLYAGLIETILSGKIEKVKIPKSIPSEEQKSWVAFQTVITLLGKILLLLFLIFIFSHCLLTFAMVAMYWTVRIVVKQVWGFTFKRDWWLYYMSIICSTFGIFFTPSVIVYIALNTSNYWQEIQSWMIAYIIWGILTFVITAAVPYLNEKKKKKIVRKIMNIMFYIIGADFGEHGFWTVTGAYAAGSGGQGKNKTRLLLAFSYAFFSLSALLPAAIAGFIANYIFEEKFVLKCGLHIDVQQQDLCFQSRDECCQIISSHDYSSFYEFVAGLTTNLIATWAVIRICGYLLLNAFPVFTIYAKLKRKN